MPHSIGSSQIVPSRKTTAKPGHLARHRPKVDESESNHWSDLAAGTLDPKPTSDILCLDMQPCDASSAKRNDCFDRKST